MFRCYILHQLCAHHIPLKESFTIILQTRISEVEGYCQWMQFRENGRIRSETSPDERLPHAWADMLMTPTPSCGPIYYLTDGIPPVTSSLDPARVHILEVSSDSPHRRRWNSFEDGLTAGWVHERYMPLASLDEIEHMRPYLRPSLSIDEVRERYRILGGSIRNVLVKTHKSPDAILARDLAYATTLDTLLAGSLSDSTISGDMQACLGMPLIPSTIIHHRVIEESEEAETQTVVPNRIVDDNGDAYVVPVTPSPSPFAGPHPFSRFEPIFASPHIRYEIRKRLRAHCQFVGHALPGDHDRTTRQAQRKKAKK